MEIGCCTNMIASEPDGTGIEYVEKLAQQGFDYIELPLAEMTALPDKDIASLVRRVEASGIRCETCNNFFPKTIRLTGPGVEPAAIHTYVENALSRAAELGVEQVVFGSGPAKNVPPGYSMAEGYGQVVALLQQVEPVAKRYGITIVIEPLRKAECNLVNTFVEGCKLAEDVGRDNIKVLVDFYHLSQEGESVQGILNLGGQNLRHVHFARNEGRGYPRDWYEDEHYAMFFSALRSAGYNRRISLEAFTTDFAVEAPRALRFFREHL